MGSFMASKGSLTSKMKKLVKRVTSKSVTKKAPVKPIAKKLPYKLPLQCIEVASFV